MGIVSDQGTKTTTTPQTIDFEALARATDANVRILARGAVDVAESSLALSTTLWTAQRTCEQFTPDLLDVMAVTLADLRTALDGLHMQFDDKKGT